MSNTHTHARTHAHTHTRVCVCVLTLSILCVLSISELDVFIVTNRDVYIYMCVCVCVYVCVCVCVCVNPFNPMFLLLFFFLPSVNWTCSLLQIGMSVKHHNRIANSVDPEDTANFELPHQSLYCLHRYLGVVQILDAP